MIPIVPQNFQYYISRTGGAPPYRNTGWMRMNICDSELPQTVNQVVPVNVNTGRVLTANVVRPGYYENVILRTNSLHVGNEVIFGWDGQTVTDTARGFYDLNSVIPAGDAVAPGDGGAANNPNRIFSSTGGVGAGDRAYTFSQVVRILKDIGLLQRGVGWRYVRP